MSKKVIEKLEEFIRENASDQKNHWLRTGFWIRKIYPDANDEMYIASIGHDIERLFPLEKEEVQPKDSGWDDEKFNLWHGGRSAKYLEKLLLEFGYDNKESIVRIKRLVTSHEVGGNDEQNAVKDADSISFLENNVDKFIDWIPRFGKESIIKKFDYMFNRINSQKAKEIARSLHKKAIKKIGIS